MHNPSTKGMPLRVLLADDHVWVRAGLRQLLESVSWVQVVSEVSDGPTAIAEAHRLQPDVAVIDVALPCVNGVRVALAIREHCPMTRVLLLSPQEDLAYLRRSIEAGAHGFVVKSTADRHLLPALERVATGTPFFQSPTRMHGLPIQKVKAPASMPPDSALLPADHPSRSTFWLAKLARLWTIRWRKTRPHLR